MRMYAQAASEGDSQVGLQSWQNISVEQSEDLAVTGSSAQPHLHQRNLLE